MFQTDDEPLIKSLIEEMGVTEKPFMAAFEVAPEQGRRDYLILDAAANDMHFFSLAYLQGFDLIPTHPKASKELKGWVATIPRNRSLWTVASIMATALCAAIEGYLRSVGERWIDEEVVARLRTTPRGTELSADNNDARIRIRRWLKPSTRDGGDKWIGRINDIFETQIGPATAKVLIAMVSMRNCFVHMPRPARNEDYRIRSADMMAGWTMAALVLGRHILLKENERHSKGAFSTSAHTSGERPEF